jgi:holliday junction DNA helicase RuvA
MIAQIRGTITEKLEGSVVMDCNGLGYEVSVPADLLTRLDRGTDVRLRVLSVYREDSAALYGFESLDEREVFRLLLAKVQGVGPKLALNVLSKIDANLLRHLVATKNIAGLTTHLGPKMAPKVMDGLLGHVTSPSEIPPEAKGWAKPKNDLVVQNAIATLLALGWKRKDAFETAEAVRKQLPDTADVSELVKQALKFKKA